MAVILILAGLGAAGFAVHLLRRFEHRRGRSAWRQVQRNFRAYQVHVLAGQLFRRWRATPRLTYQRAEADPADPATDKAATLPDRAPSRPSGG